MRQTRPGGRRRALAGLLLTGFLGAGASCSSAGDEEQLLRRFFDAISRGDTVTAFGFSVAAFPGGAVSAWEVVEIREETTGPYRIGELLDEERDSVARRDEQFQSLYAFQQANRDDLDRISARRERDPDAAIGGRLGSLAEEWDDYGEERRALVRALSEVQMAIELERRRTRRSLLRDAPVDYLTGEVAQKEVVVRITEEEAGVRDYLFSLLRYDLVNQYEAEVPSRWIIGAIDTLPGSAGDTPSP